MSENWFNNWIFNNEYSKKGPSNFWELGKTLNLGTYKPNTEMQFSLSDLDTEEKFNNIQGTRYQGHPLWLADSFTYKYNSHGFRSREFDLTNTQPKILTLGCSHTVGVGVPQYENWAEQFGRRYFINHTVWNAGLGGAGADTVARLAINMIPIIKPDIVAILWPSLYRFETYEKGPQFNGPWLHEVSNLQFEDNTAYNNQTKNKTILQLLQEIYKFKLLSVDFDDTTQKVYNTVTWTKARDGTHFGIDWHQQMAYDFYLQYSNNEDFVLKYTDPKKYWEKYKDKEVK
jgi:hypothetical protein